ncbi:MULTISPECIES: FtsW/RodA/SpoVE family cell cycle protein [Bacillus cereus group]|uniref:Rod shape-determining protein RodA n=1 Tax=Bacillus cereus TaxID=1396 RepID=A0AA44TGP1_BACCE|nr:MULTISPECIES: FtsW/RodA/SpoVE family cell cycle protein [Bacillus cereus group]PFA24252.1 rod shape-determining protein RodA [Bacillus cereus]PFN09689.1 rod shape-determining protein RodA [Bacillus cereus]PFO81598.1 rod shape-determining protein RodA [Bacillus cereus]PFR25514.1 rod shape-determining protein RodA [Bacillus cereus]PFS02723.1 rod shape-determining protein RodA [Bacillus cereus]
MKRSTEFLKSLDVKLILILCILCVTSIVAIYSSQQTGQYGDSNFAMKQGINYVIGIMLLLLVASIDLDQLQKLAWPFYIVGFASIIILKISPFKALTPEILGAKRWFRVPVLGAIQPSEFFKIALLILIASLAVKHNAKYMARTFQTDLILVGKVSLVSIPPALLVYSQPDTGMVFLYAAGIACILFMSGIQKKLIALCTVIPVAVLSTLIFIYVKYPGIFFNKLVTLLKPHQQSRILGWLDPFEHADQGYQTQQSILAVGSGGMDGKGFGYGNVYIPEKHTDFIFATIAEEGGFLIAAFVVFMFLLLLYRTIIIGYSADNLFGTLLCAGVIGVLTVQIFQNVGMIVGLMPVKGIALPFLSYGGSSLFSNMMMMGLVLSVRKTYKKYMFSVS